MPAVDLRELVKNPIHLTGSLVAHGSPHPLHEAISRSREFTSDEAAPVRIPAGGRGLDQLRYVLAQPISGVDPARAHEALVRMLAETKGTVLLPGHPAASAEGLDASQAARVRSALLCAVFADADERIIDGEVEFPRMGAVGVLSVLPSDVDKKVIEGAWLDVGWFHSTTTMAESIAKVPGLVALPPKAHRLVQILLADDLVDEDPALLENLARFAHVLGVKPIIHRVVADRAGGVATDVLRTNPSELLVIGAGVHDAPVSAFTARYGGSNLHRSLADSGEDAFRWFAENLPRIVGVGPALIGLRALMADPARPPLPVRSPDLCRHHGSNVYVRDATSKIWWTRDFAQHGGSIFKTYLQIDGQLRWQADHDGDGKVITKKWKGSEGRTIHMRETTVCSNPAKHTS